MRRRLIAVFLGICLAAGVLPVEVCAVSEETVEISFSVRNGCWPGGDTVITWEFPVGYVLTEADLPQGMEPNPGWGGGSWRNDPAGQTVTEPAGYVFWFHQIRTVTFCADGGRWRDGATQKTSNTISDQALEELPEAPERAGYFFMGWYTASDGRGRPLDPEQAVVEDETFYACWREALTVTFDAFGGCWTVETENEDHELIESEELTREAELARGLVWEDCFPEEPAREGFAFDGWETEDGTAFDGAFELGEEITAYARWKQRYTLEYRGNAGEEPVENLPETQTDTENIFTLSDQIPERPGHRFLGWHTDPGAETGMVFENGQAVLSDPSLVLYAVWQKRVCKAVFFLPEGQCAEEETLWGGSVPLPEAEALGLDREGRRDVEGRLHRFVGWRRADGSVFHAGDPLWEDVSLRPVWIPQARVRFLIENGTWEDDSRERLVVTDEGAPLEALLPAPLPEAGFKPGAWTREPVTAADTQTFTYVCAPLDRFSVTFLSEGSSPETAEVAEGEALGALPDPQKDGWIFAGWYTAETGGEAFDSAAPIRANMTLYARWQEVFTLSYHGNSEETVQGLPPAQSGTEGNFPIPETVPERPGHRFLGWALDPAVEEPAWAPGGRFLLSEDTVLYAIWEAVPAVTLRYDPNGGEYPPPEDRIEGIHEAYTFLVSEAFPCREGYTFQGWAESPDAGEPRYHGGDTCAVTGDTVLYAVWKEISDFVRVTFYDRNVEFFNGTVPWGACVGQIPDPVREGWEFLGWNTRPDGTGETVGADTALTQDLAAYAQWRQLPKKCTVIFLVGEEEIFRLQTEAGSPLSQLPETPVQEGFFFRGWNTRRDGAGENVELGAILEEDTLLYAQWEKITDATVTFFDRGEQIEKVSLEIGARLGTAMPRAPERKGWRFLGWNTRRDGTGKTVYNSTVIKEDTEVYALWEEIQYATVTFLDRGEQVDKVRLELGGKVNDQMPPNPVRSGYTFKGWYTGKNGGGMKLNRTTAIEGDLQVHAYWTGRGGNPKTGDPFPRVLLTVLISGTALAGIWNKRKKED